MTGRNRMLEKITQGRLEAVGRNQAVAIPLIDGTAGERLPVKPAHGSACNGCGWCWCCASKAGGVATRSQVGHWAGQGSSGIASC